MIVNLFPGLISRRPTLPHDISEVSCDRDKVSISIGDCVAHFPLQKDVLFRSIVAELLNEHNRMKKIDTYRRVQIIYTEL